MSVSRQNERFESFAELRDFVVPVTTFSSNIGAVSSLWRMGSARHQLSDLIRFHKPHAIIELMPHIWSPLVASLANEQGTRYVTIVHDAEPHPGDYRSQWANWVTRIAIRRADLILTLSGSVAGRLGALGNVPTEKIYPLFHPDLNYGNRSRIQRPQVGEPVRLLFFGRIMPYKGLWLFLDMVDELLSRGINVEVGVMGEGTLGSCANRLQALKAEVINRWLTEEEIAHNFNRFHAVVLSHVEASQSGVAATALGAGLPVVATPVGGLIEQIDDGITGVLSARADAWSLADAVQRLVFDEALYEGICRNISVTSEGRSFSRFVEECVLTSVHAKTNAFFSANHIYGCI